MAETALHVGSGKVRELYALGDDRLLIDGIRQDFRLRRRPADADSRQGSRSHRPLRLLVRPYAARSCPTICSGVRPDGRSLECRRLEMLPVELVVRGYLSGSGWRDYRRPVPSAATRSRRDCGSRIGWPLPS